VRFSQGHAFFPRKTGSTQTSMRLRILLPLILCFSFASAENLHLRDGLPHFTEKLAAKNDAIRIAYLGGSITAGVGASAPEKSFQWMLSSWIRKQNPGANIASFDASMGGTGSWLGAFRCWNDAGYQRPDLVLVEFAVDDEGLQENEVIASMEGMVRQLKLKTPSKPDVAFIYTLSKTGFEKYKNGELPPVVQFQEKVATHYGIPSVVMAKDMSDQIVAGKLSLDAFSKNGLETNDAIQAAYFESLKPLIEKSAALPKAEAKPLPSKLSPQAMENAKLAPYDWAELDAGWLGWQLSSSDRIPHVAVSDKPGSTMTLKFKGTQVGIYNIIGPDTGNIDFSINDGPWKHQVLFDKDSISATRPAGFKLVDQLDPTKDHTLKIRIAQDQPEGSKGRFTRLGWFLVDGLAKDPNGDLDPLSRIDAIYSTMKPVTWEPPADRWNHLEKTRAKLQNGPVLNMVMLGDSIIGDTSGSQFEFLLDRAYPKSKVNKVTSVRGSTGCWWYKDENRVEEYVLKHHPDILVIGGISQRGDIEAIRSVIHQCRAKLPELEVLLLAPTFGAPRDPHNAKWTAKPDPNGDPYRTGLQKLAAEEKCGFFDMTGPWWEYIQSSGYALDSFKRDVVHANDRGRQILGRLLEKFLGPS